MRVSAVTWLLSCATVLTLGCGEDDKPETNDEPCSPGTAEGCEAGQVCESVMDGEPACFAPVVLRGRVLDLSTGQGVAEATVVALDINGAARSSVAVSGDDGAYEVALPTLRTAEGTALADPVTLRVAAAGYQAFPTPPREALPIEIAFATSDDGAPSAVQSAATNVGLIALLGDRSNDAVIEGEIAVAGEADEGEDDHNALAAGALVLAVQNGQAVSSAISDLDGNFVLWNVPPGQTRVEAYKAGLNAEARTLDAAARQRVEDLVLSAAAERLSAVSGSVNIVNAEGGLQTSVILVPESTFDPIVVRGTAPAGLRASGVSGAFEIRDVPPGRYAVLAAFENDRLVRDPDSSIGGTDIVYVDVAEGADQTLDESFKVTEALAVMGPGADGAEVISMDGDPTFSWVDDSSEDGYELRVFDAFGELVHEALDVDRVTGSERVSYTWSNAPLQRGMVYQFRVVSYREGRGMGGGRSYISATEDLRGVFQAGAADEQEMETP